MSGSSPTEPHSESAEITKLREELASLVSQNEKLVLSGYSELELDEHIKRLHTYNETKDVAQALMGRMAVLLGVATKDLYAKYGLELND